MSEQACQGVSGKQHRDDEKHSKAQGLLRYMSEQTKIKIHVRADKDKDKDKDTCESR
jgi:hypothetical protein